MNKTVWLSIGLIACNAKGSVVVDPEGNFIEEVDTAVVDTGVDSEPDDQDTDNPDTDNSDTDTQDTQDTTETGTDTDSDTQDTGPEDTDPVEIPADNDNPNIYPNYWQGVRSLNYQGCTEDIIEYGTEVSNDYPTWMSMCDCDEIYYVQTDRAFACNVPLSTVFYRAIKYNGTEIEVRYYPGNPSSPEPSSLLAIGGILSDGETWAYEYSAEYQGYPIQIDGEVLFFE